MCKHGTYEHMVISGRVRDIDACIFPLVKALNEAGIVTVACCCGHGHRPGNIALEDGRELVIAPDYATGRKVDRAFPSIEGDERPDTRWDLSTQATGGES
jgi:hypothetical protein